MQGGSSKKSGDVSTKKYKRAFPVEFDFEFTRKVFNPRFTGRPSKQQLFAAKIDEIETVINSEGYD